MFAMQESEIEWRRNAPLGLAPVLPVNISKGLPVTNALAYFHA
jgi:hypothetical protein